jgi:hypothetical protein
MPLFYYNLFPEGLPDVEEEQILYSIVLVAYHLTPPEAYLVLPILPKAASLRFEIPCNVLHPHHKVEITDRIL